MRRYPPISRLACRARANMGLQRFKLLSTGFELLRNSLRFECGYPIAGRQAARLECLVLPAYGDAPSEITSDVARYRILALAPGPHRGWRQPEVCGEGIVGELEHLLRLLELDRVHHCIRHVGICIA